MSFFLVYRLSPPQNRSSQAEWPGLQLHQTTAVKFLGPPFTVWLQARDSISLCRRFLIYDEGMILLPTSQGRYDAHRRRLGTDTGTQGAMGNTPIIPRSTSRIFTS